MRPLSIHKIIKLSFKEKVLAQKGVLYQNGKSLRLLNTKYYVPGGHSSCIELKGRHRVNVLFTQICESMLDFKSEPSGNPRTSMVIEINAYY